MDFKTKSKKTSLAILFIFSAYMLSGCKEKPRTETTQTYKTMQVALSNDMVSSNYSASIQGTQNVEIRPQLSGLITDICINEGATVRKGQTLFIIDQVPYKAALETAKANVMSAEAKVGTAQLTADSKLELYKENVISEFELQTAQNSLLEAKAVLAQAKANEVNTRNSLSYTIIKSPVDGVASMIPYKVGSLVSPSITEPLVTVSSENEMYAYFSMTENQILSLIQGNENISDIIKNMPAVRLILNDGTPYNTTGKIDAISGTIDTQTGAISVRACFANPKRILRNGGSATIIIPYEKKDCIVIPKAATFEIQDKTYVYKVVDGKATSVEIFPFKINNGTQYIVESGLTVGDVIVAEGAGLLREGTPIQASK
jgi:membrane fusion protein (multidrug efflux system)